MDPSNPKASEFFRQLLHTVLNASIFATIWRLPTVVLVLLIVGIIALIAYFGLY